MCNCPRPLPSMGRLNMDNLPLVRLLQLPPGIQPAWPSTSAYDTPLRQSLPSRPPGQLSVNMVLSLLIQSRHSSQQPQDLHRMVMCPKTLVNLNWAQGLQPAQQLSGNYPMQPVTVFPSYLPTSHSFFITICKQKSHTQKNSYGQPPLNSHISEWILHPGSKST